MYDKNCPRQEFANFLVRFSLNSPARVINNSSRVMEFRSLAEDLGGSCSGEIWDEIGLVPAGGRESLLGDEIPTACGLLRVSLRR